MLKTSLYFMPVRRISALWSYSPRGSRYTPSSSSKNPSQKMVVRAKTTDEGRSCEIISRTADNPSNEDRNFLQRGYIELWKKPRKREQTSSTKTLSAMQENIDKWAKTLHVLRKNEKLQSRKTPLVDVSEQKFDEKRELRLSTYVDGSVERLSFTVRTPDRRILIKKFTGISSSRFAFTLHCSYFLFSFVGVSKCFSKLTLFLLGILKVDYLGC